MKTVIKRIEVPDGRRVMMLSDPHGHAKGLREVLEKASFCDDDFLFIVGDIIEKGPESLQTLRLVMDMCERGNTFAVMGNVDLWRIECLLSDDAAKQQAYVDYSLKALHWFNACFLGELCSEIGIQLTENIHTQSVFPLLREHFQKEFTFLSSLPTILETQKMIFVHGGIPHERLNELEGEDCYPFLKRDRFLDEGFSFQKFVVTGHWPVTLYQKSFPCHNPVIERNRHIICLDGGCGIKRDGQLNLLSIPDWKSECFSLYTWDDLPQIQALEDQASAEGSFYLLWSRELPVVELVQQGNEMSVIRHHGLQMQVPISFLWKENGQWCCEDICDYRLNVKAGDRLSLIYRTAQGCFVKKDGVAGWYMGRSK